MSCEVTQLIVVVYEHHRRITTNLTEDGLHIGH